VYERFGRDIVEDAAQRNEDSVGYGGVYIMAYPDPEGLTVTAP